MVELIPSPDAHALLPPLLACLPTAFASSRPPPALLPLLSPILRQRLQLISSSPHDSWLRLLTWDNGKAESLKETVENSNFEPHPSSGEVELGELDPITYKRLDSETLRAQLSLPDWSLTAMYLWCTGSEEGNAWRLAELVPYTEELQHDKSWSSTIQEADETSNERLVTEALLEADKPQQRKPSPAGDDEDYWAMYDGTPGRTPARKHSVVPQENRGSEADYYSRYNDVQPAMDSHDPDEEVQGAAESTLNGNALHEILSRQSAENKPPSYQEPLYPADDEPDEKRLEVNQPVPSSPSSRGSDAVARLEETAERFGASDIAIRQHISTTMKSMFRLAKSAGMDREEFDRIVQRELEALSIFDRDD